MTTTATKTVERRKTQAGWLVLILVMGGDDGDEVARHEHQAEENLGIWIFQLRRRGLARRFFGVAWARL